jgi:hypothetical protein
METRSVENVFRALQDAAVRYLVAGGLAVVAHGYVRMTVDIDLIVDLSPDNARRMLDALGSLGYRPLIPVAMESFADAEIRRTWVVEKDARVFQLYSDQHPTARVDVFIEEPLDFDAALEHAKWEPIAPDLEVPFVSLEDLIALKEAASRPRDLIDVAKLRALQAHRNSHDED